MRKQLTDEAVKAAKPSRGAGRVEIYDTLCPGLVLRVGAQSKTYMFYYRHAGAFQKATIGPAGAIKLSKAREIARARREKVIAGLDPALAVEGAPETFNELFEAFSAQSKRKKKAADRSLFAKHIAPTLGNQRLLALDGPMFARLQDKIAKQVKEARDSIAARNTIDIVMYDGARTADLAIGLCKSILRWGIPRGYVDRDYTTGINRLQSGNGRDRVLDDNELRSLLQQLAVVYPDEQRQIALRLLLLLGSRKSEVLNAQQDELRFDEPDPHWLLPASRSKNGHAYKVPLVPVAVALFQRAIDIAGPSNFVFPSPETGQPFAGTALHDRLKKAFRPGSKLVREKSGKLASELRAPQLTLARFTIHDLRRSVATGMARLGVDRLIIAKVLNHRTADRASITGIVYDRHEYSKEKRTALATWAAHLATLEHKISSALPDIATSDDLFVSP
jgi:integrase